MIKFQAKVNQGKIEIPEIYQNDLQMVETIEIIIPNPPESSSLGIIHRLIKNPIEIQDFTPLKREEIYD
jgi:hypothetical protein